MKVIGFSQWPVLFNARPADAPTLVSLAAICPGCQKPIAALSERTLSMAGNHSQQWTNAMNSLLGSASPIEVSHLKLLATWPEPPEPQIPEHLPAPVQKAFLQAENNFPLPGHEEAAAMMYRRSLELALSTKYPNVTGTLAQIIKTLVEQHVLTADLGTWANDVRLLGNEAAHAEGVTKDELVMMRGFADAVLRYVWTLPTQVAQRRTTAN